MVWDLGKAMRKKEEFESARLMDFEFRQRARAASLLACALGVDSAAIVRAIARHDDAGFIEFVATEVGRDADAVASSYRQCLSHARTQLIAERGDPTPYKLA